MHTRQATEMGRLKRSRWGHSECSAIRGRGWRLGAFLACCFAFGCNRAATQPIPLALPAWLFSTQWMHQECSADNAYAEAYRLYAAADAGNDAWLAPAASLTIDGSRAARFDGHGLAKMMGDSPEGKSPRAFLIALYEWTDAPGEGDGRPRIEAREALLVLSWRLTQVRCADADVEGIVVFAGLGTVARACERRAEEHRRRGTPDERTESYLRDIRTFMDSKKEELTARYKRP